MQRSCSVTQKWKCVVLSYPGCEQAFSMNSPRCGIFIGKSNWPILQHFTGFMKVTTITMQILKNRPYKMSTDMHEQLDY